MSKKEKAAKALKTGMRIKAAVDTGGMSEVIPAAKNVFGKPGQERRKARRAARKAKRAANYAGGEQIGNKTSFTQPRKNLNQGGQPQYKSGDMPKAKPC